MHSVDNQDYINIIIVQNWSALLPVFQCMIFNRELRLAFLYGNVFII